MSLVSHALGFSRFRRESPMMALLRSDHLPVVLAVVAQYFPQGALARPAHEIYVLLDEGLRQLRGDGFNLPRGPQDYVGDWVRSGWLVRRPGTVRTGETLEPSEDVLAVLDALQRWDSPHRSVSASRIESLSLALQTLAQESDPDAGRRLGELERQREEIERRIEATHRGEFEVLAPTQITERMADILDLAASIPADFARVRHELGDLNRQLRRQLLDPEDSRGEVLEEIFRGVDLIGDSDAGRSFNSFFDVLLDRERTALIDRWIAEVLGREETQEVPEHLRVGLHRLFRDMEEAAYEVSQEMTGLARSLRHYVTTEEFAENRRMIQLLRATRHSAAAAAQEGSVSALNQMETPLVRIGMQLRSVAAMRLRNPGEERVDDVPRQVEEVELDAEVLLEQIRASEIDFEELEEAVEAALAARPVATIAQVLELTPATQGLASVVGLLYLAMSRGVPTGHAQTVQWEDAGEELPVRVRRARISGWQFTRGTDEEEM